MIRKEITNEDERRAMKLLRRDARARALAISCVAYAMNEENTDAPADARRYAHDVATLATALLVSRIYLDDGELNALRRELEAMRENLIDLQMRTPRPLFIPKEGFTP